jgi:hypothetical protein
VGHRGSAWRQVTVHGRGVPKGGRGAHWREAEGCWGAVWHWWQHCVLDPISDGVSIVGRRKERESYRGGYKKFLVQERWGGGRAIVQSCCSLWIWHK